MLASSLHSHDSLLSQPSCSGVGKLARNRRMMRLCPGNGFAFDCSAQSLHRFFAMVWVAIGVLAASGLAMVASAARVPAGWEAMAANGLVMFAVFAPLFVVPYRRLRRAVQAADWAAAGAQVKTIPRLAMINFVLGWIAIAAVRFVP